MEYVQVAVMLVLLGHRKKEKGLNTQHSHTTL